MPTGGWSGLWNRHFSEQHSLLRPFGGRIGRIVSGHARKRGGITSMGANFVLTGETYRQVKGQVTPGLINGGGMIVTETVTPLQDGTFVTLVQQDSQPNTYPPDLSGNGGGGKNGLRI